MRPSYLLPCLAMVLAGNPASAASGFTWVDLSDQNRGLYQHASEAYDDYLVVNPGESALGLDDSPEPGVHGTVSAISSAISPGSLGFVSVDMSATRSISGSNSSHGWAQWSINFVNETGSASDFLITVSTDYWQSTSVIDPLVPAGWTLSGPPSSYELYGRADLSLNIGYGTGISLNAQGPGLHSFSTGVLQPGESIFLGLSANGDALAMVFPQQLCPVGSTGSAACTSVWQKVSANYGTSASLVSIAAVPEPATCLLAGLGLVAAAFVARRRSVS